MIAGFAAWVNAFARGLLDLQLSDGKHQKSASRTQRSDEDRPQSFHMLWWLSMRAVLLRVCTQPETRALTAISSARVSPSIFSLQDSLFVLRFGHEADAKHSGRNPCP